MIISRSKKFIYLSNPKCGSSTVRGYMLPHTQISLESMRSNATEENYQNVGKLINPETLHICAHHLKKSFDIALQNADQNEEAISWEDYYKFGTIRNPFRRMVSWYFFVQPDKNFQTVLDRNTEEGYDVDSAFEPHFNEYVEHLQDNSDKALPPYSFFYTDWDTGELLVDDVFKIETIDENFQSTIKEKLDIDLPSPLPRLLPNFTKKEEESYNVRFKGDPYELYNDNSIAYIEDHFSSDIEAFNYEFGQ